MTTHYEEYIPAYPSIDDEEFYKRIVEKKEFWDGQDDMFFRHQMNIARYMAQWTLFGSLFIYHEMGTGKSALSVAMTELVKSQGYFKKVIYISHNQTQLFNYKNEIRQFSLRLASMMDPNTSEDKVRYKWNSILAKDGYEFYTFGTLSGEFDKKSDAWIRERYDQSILIIDEAHHLVQSNKEEDKKSYNTITRLLSVIPHKKLLVMSGTPIRDQPDEVIPLLNLVVPSDKQMSRTGFIQTFFNVRDHIQIFDTIKIPIYEWKQDAKKDFMKRIQGCVSYVKRRLSNATIQYQGHVFPPMENIRVLPHRMEAFQNMVYTDIFRRERLGEEETAVAVKSSFYSGSKQASLFVFPDENVGDKGFRKFITPQFTLRPNFLEVIGDYKNMPTGSILDQLRQFSASYAYVIQQILDHPKELVYVFSDLVEGSGILLFMSILKTLFGFKLVVSKKDLVDTKGDRMILLNDRVADEDDYQDFIQYFNRPENKHGDFCQVIMGTNKTREGISLRNVRQIHIMTPSWNFADTSQAMSRSLRAQSHNDLEDPIVKIYLHVSVPFTGEEEEEDAWLRGDIPINKNELLFSVDYQRYYRSEIKERNAKLLDRVFLECSWDCLMNVPHNTETGRNEDYSRECEYDLCHYQCHGIQNAQPGTDTSNLNAFYSQEEQLQVMNDIYSFFSQASCAHLEGFIPQHNKVLVRRCLDAIIHDPIVLRDNRNLPCFLQYKNGILFLTDNPYLPVSNNHYEMYYQQYPSTKIIFPLPNLLDSYFIKNQNIILPKLVRLIQQSSPNAKKLFLSFPLLFQSLFCETTIQSQLLHPSKVSLDARSWFVKEFKTDITYIPNILIDHRFTADKKNARRLDLKNPSIGWKTLASS